MSDWIYPFRHPPRWAFVRYKDRASLGQFGNYGVSRSDVLRHDCHEVLEEGKDDSDKEKDRLMAEVGKMMMVKNVMER